MKNSKSFIHYYQALDKKFKKYFQETLISDDTEGIHRLRVMLKKIKAFFHMLNYLDDHFHFKKSFHDFETIFREAGRIRDIQVRLSLFDSIEKEINLPLVNQRRRSEKDEKTKFISYKKKLKKETGFHIEVKKKIVRFLKKGFSSDSIKLYLISQSDEIAERMNNHTYSYRELHELRIHLKRYYYNLVFVNDYLFKNKAIRKHIERLDKLQEQLGRLHDSVSVFGLTKKFRAGRDFSKTEMKAIRLLNARLQRSIEKEALEIRRNFHTILVDFRRVEKGLLVSAKGDRIKFS